MRPWTLNDWVALFAAVGYTLALQRSWACMELSVVLFLASGAVALDLAAPRGPGNRERLR